MSDNNKLLVLLAQFYHKSVSLWFDLKRSFLSLQQGKLKLQRVKTLVTVHIEATVNNSKELD